ncbi:WD40-repeat-containing domain protein [Fusarium redolens]|uniref:WD40-repeat-containing domain protein n=1 Tax=Fusarium redolens TaxID=48865 RepID=A0A9P9H188_FUSRE|nr:WD40-repeat-containing domain protein [Fusarium redolens]KAH7248811.1 WD40-repeat-containing domain protein [Fusarium redolens]
MSASIPPSPGEETPAFDLNLQHGHKDLVQAVAFNTYGDRCATGSVDGKIRVFNRHKDGTWRLCDTWTAHGGEIIEIQWLPATVYPNLIASLGIEGWFRLWAEDPSAAPGRRFCTGRAGNGKPAFDTRSNKAPYRSFSMKHNEETRHTYLALLATDGRLTVYENDQPENLSEYASIDEFSVAPKPNRGEELAFRVRFDPNPEPCYTALRAGVPSDSLGLVVAAMDTVKVYRSRDIVATSIGVQQTQKEFYLAVELTGHRGLVRDVSWAAGNIRGYDVIATACQDGYARVFRIETPYSEDDGKSWSAADLLRSAPHMSTRDSTPQARTNGTATPTEKQATTPQLQPHSYHQHQHHPSGLSASLAKSGSHNDRQWSGQPGQVKHNFQEISKLDNHRTPVWRVGFDDDGHILGSTGDDGRLLCYRQTPNGAWAKSSELAVQKARMATP